MKKINIEFKGSINKIKMNKNKITPILFSILVTLSILLSSNFLFAITPVNLSVSSISGAIGSEVQININISADSYLGAGQFRVTYDPTKLQITASNKILKGLSVNEQVTAENNGDISGTTSMLTSTIPLATAGVVLASITSTEGFTYGSDISAGSLLRIKFIILPGATGDIPVTLSVTEFNSYTAGNPAIPFTVVQQGKVTVATPLTGITLNKSATLMGINGTETLTVNKLPSNTTDNPTITWGSEDSAIATVDLNTGLITGKAVGSTRITATSSIGGFTAFCDVTAGTTIWRNNKAILGLNIEKQETDVFWLTLSHEIAHLLAHSHKNFHFSCINDAKKSEDDINKFSL